MYSELKTPYTDFADFAGRWLYNVTVITESMKNEILCQRFFDSNKDGLKTLIKKELEFALPCPCQEVLMIEVSICTRLMLYT
ncbi:hypothetical protein DPMN_050114 [Dreissena polymorpha]|uniref:Uncharacterized protein n=1 Tax=Dreissena polymorpha TaxID=45954 RepID=A0A9D4CGU4_DREPO|nr:hypothetical protein DPMN_050114 [Dreissena polymorpha]